MNYKCLWCNHSINFVLKTSAAILKTCQTWTCSVSIRDEKIKHTGNTVLHIFFFIKNINTFVVKIIWFLFFCTYIWTPETLKFIMDIGYLFIVALLNKFKFFSKFFAKTLFLKEYNTILYRQNLIPQGSFMKGSVKLINHLWK